MDAENEKPIVDVAEQRRFLHDLATPLGTALFVIDSLSENLLASPNAPAKSLSYCETLVLSLNKMRDMIEDFRAKLKES